MGSLYHTDRPGTSSPPVINPFPVRASIYYYYSQQDVLSSLERGVSYRNVDARDIRSVTVHKTMYKQALTGQ